MLLLLAVLLPGAGCKSTPKQVMVEYETVAPASARNTERARELNARAIDAIEKGEFDSAEQAAKTALSHDVSFGPAHNTLGRVYYHQERYYLAAWEFQYAAKLMPHHPEPRNNLGLVLEAVGKYDQALAEYDQALTLEPDNPEVIANLARTYDKHGHDPKRLKALLIEIVEKDQRPAWRQWAKDRLGTLGHPLQP